MKKKTVVKHPVKEEPESNKDFEGYPYYPESQDIYSMLKEEQDIDPEDTTKPKSSNTEDEPLIDEDFESDEIVSGDDLDIPGSELDDEAEEAGNEDEENNYYSIGGDKHVDLEEDQGDRGEI